MIRHKSVPPVSAAAALAVGLLALLISCATVPITNRQSLQMVPDAELMALSLQQYRQVLEKSRLSSDQKQVAMVRKVGMKLARASEDFLREAGMESSLAYFQWDFNLIEDDKMINAWVMPGGKAAVYTGILPFTRDETGLAVVLGHEVAHAIAGHGNERMSQALLAQMGGIALSAALSSQPRETQAMAMAAFGAGASIGILLPYSRLHESEADRIGLTLMARCGYDPRAAVPFWERMNQAAQSRPPEFLSTHPAPDTRIENIQKYIPEAMPHFEKAVAR
ncbi:MAG: peptidase M48 [Deltaproteobacteria bacterium SG8_13]|nr:MAG: peptidase M48 [Deltaproteobacteria bacterium SG8_13]